MYQREADAAVGLGIATDLLDFESLVNDGDAERATRRVAEPGPDDLCVYRGWRMQPAQYTALFEALQRRGVVLVNDPDAYRRCHYLPEWYASLADSTPRSVWLTDTSLDAVMHAVQPLALRHWC
jgi:glutathione synthase/RimK-type ligase-like ATP-grasp enzyme